MKLIDVISRATRDLMFRPKVRVLPVVRLIENKQDCGAEDVSPAFRIPHRV